MRPILWRRAVYQEFSGSAVKIMPTKKVKGERGYIHLSDDFVHTVDIDNFMAIGDAIEKIVLSAT
jgi:hypothetical protein